MFRSPGLFLALWLTGLSGLALAAESEPVLLPENETVVVGDVSYVSGGVGEESREQLKAFAAAFNLKLLLAHKSGAYIGDVQIVIVDGKGKEILKAVAEGPIFMANLPAGRYEVIATTEGLTQKLRATVVKGKLGTLVFRWP
jgi:hypothetical protein